MGTLSLLVGILLVAQAVVRDFRSGELFRPMVGANNRFANPFSAIAVLVDLVHAFGSTNETAVLVVAGEIAVLVGYVLFQAYTNNEIAKLDGAWTVTDDGRSIDDIWKALLGTGQDSNRLVEFCQFPAPGYGTHLLSTHCNNDLYIVAVYRSNSCD